MKYRYVCLLLALLTVGTQFAGCSGEKPAETENNTVVEETSAETEDDGFIDDDLPEKDFSGADMQILTTTWYDATQYIYAAEENGEVINDALFAQRAEVSERFNVEIGVTADLFAFDVQDLTDALALSGDDTYDIVYNCDVLVVNNALKGDFFDLKQVDVLDFSKPWWKGTTQNFTIQNKLPFTANQLALSGIYMNLVLSVNKDLAANLQIEIPYDDVKNGTWYLDDLITLAEQATIDTNGDGIIDNNDQWGLFSAFYGEMGMLSNLGGEFISKDDAGNLIYNDNLEKIVTIMEKTDHLLEFTTDDYGPATEYCAELFVNGQGLFMFAENRVLYNTVRNADIAYGILPFPKFDETQTEYNSAGFDIYWAILKPSYGNAELIGTCVEAMSCYNYNYIVPKVWENVLGGKLSDAQEDAEMFRIIRDAQYVDLGFAFSNENIAINDLCFMINRTNSGQVASYIEARKEIVKSKLEEINRVYAEMK